MPGAQGEGGERIWKDVGRWQGLGGAGGGRGEDWGVTTEWVREVFFGVMTTFGARQRWWFSTL